MDVVCLLITTFELLQEFPHHEQKCVSGYHRTVDITAVWLRYNKYTRAYRTGIPHWQLDSRKRQAQGFRSSQGSLQQDVSKWYATVVCQTQRRPGILWLR